MLPRFLFVFVLRWWWVSRQKLVAWHIRNFFRPHWREKLLLLCVFSFITTAKVSVFFKKRYANRFRKKGKVRINAIIRYYFERQLLLKEGNKSKTVFLYNRTIQLMYEKILTLNKLIIHLFLTPFFLCFFFFFLSLSFSSFFSSSFPPHCYHYPLRMRNPHYYPHYLRMLFCEFFSSLSFLLNILSVGTTVCLGSSSQF